MEKRFLLMAYTNETDGGFGNHEEIIDTVICEEDDINEYCHKMNLYRDLTLCCGYTNYHYKEVVFKRSLPVAPKGFQIKYDFSEDGSLCSRPLILPTQEVVNVGETNIHFFDHSSRRREDNMEIITYIGSVSFNILEEALKKPLGKYNHDELTSELKLDEKAKKIVKFFLSMKEE